MTVRLFVYGIVQGVGFRPFVMALAQEWNLRGTVCNTGSSVCIDLEGEESAISGFQMCIRDRSLNSINYLLVLPVAPALLWGQPLPCRSWRKHWGLCCRGLR